MTQEQHGKAAELRAMGLVIGARDPRRNTAFTGRYMVAQPCDESELPTECASTGGFCVVGDVLGELVDNAYTSFVG